MIFGLCGAPSTFQRFMDKVLQPVLGPNVHAYLDDIIITSATFEQHLELLNTVFSLLHVARLKLKPSKCKFIRNELVYFGLKITPGGLHTEDAKIKTIADFPTPQKTKRAIKIFEYD